MKSAQLLYQYDVRIHLSQRYNQYDRTIRRRRADTHAGDAPHSAQAPPRAGRPPPHALPARAARSRCPLARVHPHRLTTHERREQRVHFWGPDRGMSHSWLPCTFGRLRLGSSRRPIADARGVSNKPIVERRRCILEWSWRIHTQTAKCARLADNDESAVPHYTAPATPRAGGSAPPAACGVRSRPRQTPSTRAQVLGTCDSYPLDAACLARFR